MMRKPTPIAIAYAWHSNALKGVYGDEVRVHDETPECGWFKRRLVRGGPWVPARIWLDQPIDRETGELAGDERLHAECNGAWADPDALWPWVCGYPISKAEYDFLVASIGWTERHAPGEPMANVRQPVDWLKVPTPVF